MDVTMNVLWALAAYDKILIKFIDLLAAKETWHVQEKLWDVTEIYIQHRIADLVADSADDDFEPVNVGETPGQLMDLYPHVPRYDRLRGLVEYARILADCSNFGQQPWTRVARIIDQEWHEKKATT